MAYSTHSTVCCAVVCAAWKLTCWHRGREARAASSAWMIARAVTISCRAVKTQEPNVIMCAAGWDCSQVATSVHKNSCWRCARKAIKQATTGVIPAFPTHTFNMVPDGADPFNQIVDRPSSYPKASVAEAEANAELPCLYYGDQAGQHLACQEYGGSAAEGSYSISLSESSTPAFLTTSLLVY